MTMRTLLLALPLLALLGCEGTRADLVGTDADADGYGSWVDCDDDQAAVHPGQTEVPYNGVDDDCDPATPDDDLDADGFTREQGDCDDEDPGRHPDADEVCDGIDNDCDDTVDDGLLEAWYKDADGDGYGDAETSDQRCDPGDGTWVRDDRDCDDDDPAIHPAAVEVCDDVDNDCDDAVDTDAIARGVWYADDDGDDYGDPGTTTEACDDPGEGWVANPDDCDDDPGTGGSIHPGADETCNDTDDDCDGVVDEGAVDATTFYLDADGDDQGDPQTTLVACLEDNPDPDLWITDSRDCNDLSDQAFEGGTEVCDGLDNDCSGTADDGIADRPGWYPDDDGDGFGDEAATPTEACFAPVGHVANALDCNDDDTPDADGDPVGAAAFPGGAEVCDDLDNDCNGQVDDAASDALTWFLDADGDDHGDPARSIQACDDPTDADTTWVQIGDDCNDDDTLVGGEPVGADAWPGNPDGEACDDLDNDCNGLIDDGAPGSVDWYVDADGDTHGDPDRSVAACNQPSPLYVSSPTDCDDGDPAIKPGGDLQCGGIDANCDGSLDFDGDGDLFVDATDCPATGLDCDDADGGVHPDSGCAWGDSCLSAWEHMVGHPALVAPDGSQTFTDGLVDLEVDPQGDGSTEIAAYYCDLTDDDAWGPGWTRAYASDFEEAGDADGWAFYDTVTTDDDNAVASMEACASGNRILTPLPDPDDDEATLSSAGGWLHRAIDADNVPHDEIRVDYTYYRLESWGIGQEFGFLTLERTASRPTGDNNNVDSLLLWFEDLSDPGSELLCGTPALPDEALELSTHAWDPENAFRLEFGSTLDGANGADYEFESFGIDDVAVWIR